MRSVPVFRVRRSACLAVAAVATILCAPPADASARHRKHHVAHSSNPSDVSAVETSGRYADFVVDARTGRVLHATNADQLRHPASLTKMMTLYLLFDEIEHGRLTMESRLTVSAHAAAQSPTKLDLRPGQEISVSDAIHGLVTQSANDAAVTIAENIAGSEDAFARRMTAMAHRIGMSNTTFYNASGLPNSQQYTTARDMVTLGRALQERFPENYKVFSTRSFAYRGRVYGNHNHLLGRLDGVDGIKTGYTEASGFNLVTSVHRDGHFVVAAVMGGSSGAARDAQMMRLIEQHMSEASTGSHVASVLAEARAPVADDEFKPAAPAAVTPPLAASAPLAAPRSPAPQPQPVAAAAPPVDNGPAKPAQPHLANHPVLADKPVAKVDDRAASRIMAKAMKAEQKNRTQVASLDNFMPAAPAPKPAAPAAKAEFAQPSIAILPTHSVLARPPADRQTVDKVAADHVKPDDRARPEVDRTERLMTASIEPPHAADTPRAAAPIDTKSAQMPSSPREGWLVQIAAVDKMEDAKALLSRAQNAVGPHLGAGAPVTEAFSKGNATLYRARFAGYADQKSAAAACASLKHKDITCLVIHQ